MHRCYDLHVLQHYTSWHYEEIKTSVA